MVTPRRSGTSIRGEHPPKGGNKQPKSAFFLAAFAALTHPESRAYYDRRRDDGKRHNAVDTPYRARLAQRNGWSPGYEAAPACERARRCRCTLAIVPQPRPPAPAAFIRHQRLLPFLLWS